MMTANSSWTEVIADFTGFDIPTAVTTYNGSKEFMKLMLPVTVINILHNRTDIDRENFKRSVLKDDMDYVCAKPKSTHKSIRDYHVWMKGAKDALDKAYLREMVLIMKDQNDQVEHYKFRFKYLRKEHDTGLAGSEKAKELMSAMKNMIGQIKELQKYDKLSGEIRAKVEFLFYDGVTPLNYIPPNFYKISESQMKTFYEGKSKGEIGHLDLGIISTGYHSMKCSGFGTLLVKHANAETQETQCSIIDVSDDNNMSIVESAAPKEKIKKSSLSLTYNNTESYNKMCICMTNINVPELKVKMCIKCLCNYHIACHGYFTEDEVPAEFTCNVCAKNENLHQDAIYFEKDDKEKPDLCLLRLAIVYCSLKKVPSHILKQCKPVRRNKLTEHLIRLCVLTKKTLAFIPGTEESVSVRRLFNKTTTEEENDGNDKEDTSVSEAHTVDKDKDKDNDNSASSVISLVSSEDEKTFCVCNVHVSLPSLPTRTCSLCCKKCHIACQGYLYEDDLPDPFVCHECLEPDKLKETDLRFYNRKSTDEKRTLSMFRLLMSYCILTRDNPQVILERLPKKQQNSFLQDLIKLAIIDKNGQRGDADLEQFKILFIADVNQDSTKLPGTQESENDTKRRRLN